MPKSTKAFLLLICLASFNVRAQSYDLLIANGRVIDGTGAPAAAASVGIKDGRIARIGKIGMAEAKRVIDASGLVVAPGFIDVHTHAEDILELPEARNFVRMGVTTLMLGNCGGSATVTAPGEHRATLVSDLEETFRRAGQKGIAPNIATLIGHNTVRRIAMGGSFDRAPAAEELERMRAMVREAMEAGAFGLSTGLIYLPGTFSRTEEIIELARVAAEFGGLYASHMRDEGLEIESALKELFRIAREAGIRAHISHIKLSGKSAWNRAGTILELIDSARREGLDITQDQYVYTASSTDISQLVPEWAREGGSLDSRLKDPETRARIEREMRSRLEKRGFDDFSYAVIAHFRPDTSLNGLNIAEAARKHGGGSLDNQIALILDIVLEGGASAVFHGIGEEDLQTFLKHPNTMIAADSGIRRYRQGVPHPRGYGNNARVLGRYVNQLGLLRLEEAVRRMTSLPASVFRISGRGQLQEGFWADMVIFDSNAVRDRATFADPHQYPEGIKHVLVNGQLVVENAENTEARPGKALRLRNEDRVRP